MERVGTLDLLQADQHLLTGVAAPEPYVPSDFVVPDAKAPVGSSLLPRWLPDTFHQQMQCAILQPAQAAPTFVMG